MMVIGIAPRPIDQPDIRKRLAPPVEVIGLARIAQHIPDPRYRNDPLHRIFQLRERHAPHPDQRFADPANRPVAIADPATGQPDLAQHRGKDRRHPIGLFAMFGTLQRPRHRDQRPRGRHTPRQIANGLRIGPAQRRGPFRRLRRPVAFPYQIWPETVETHGVAIQKPLIRQTLVLQHIGQRQHERRVRTGPDRDPVAALRRVRLLRPDVDPRHPLGGKPVKPACRFMLGDPPHTDLCVLGIDPPEHDQRFGMVVDRVPTVLMFIQQLDEIDAEHMRHDRLRAARGIAAKGRDIAADAVEEPMHLTLGVMEASRRTPPVGAAENRLVPVGVADAPDLLRGNVQRLVPWQFDKILLPAPLAVAIREPPAADRRACHAAAVMHGSGQDIRNFRRVRIIRKGARRNNPVALCIHLERAPMARRDARFAPLTVWHILSSPRQPCPAISAIGGSALSGRGQT